MKDSRRSSSTIYQESVLTCCNAKFAFFSTWLFFANIYDLQDSRRRGKLSPHNLSTTSTRFTGTQALAGLLVQRANISAQLAPGIEQGTFGTLSLEFTLSTLALVAAAVGRMLKTQVTLGNISRVLLNLFKRYICNVQSLLLPPNVPIVNIRISSLVHQVRLLLTLTFASLVYLFGLCHMYIQLGRVYLRDV